MGRRIADHPAAGPDCLGVRDVPDVPASAEMKDDHVQEVPRHRHCQDVICEANFHAAPVPCASRMAHTSSKSSEKTPSGQSLTSPSGKTSIGLTRLPTCRISSIQ